MSRERISSDRRQLLLRRSSSGPGDLEEDSNVFQKDDPFWYKRMERNNTVLRPSLQLSNTEESSAVLDSGSDADMPLLQDGWWNPLGKFNQTNYQTSGVRRTIRSSGNVEPTTEDITQHEEDSLDSLPRKGPKKKKRRLFISSEKRKSLGTSAFLNVLNESITTVVSDPGPSKERKSIPTVSFISDEESFKQTKNPSTRKSRPALFSKARTTQSESTTNVFANLLEYVSSNSESSIPAVNKNQQAQTLNESQKSGVQNTRDIEPIPDTGPVVSQKKSMGTEEDHNSDPNLSQNLSEKQRTIRSSSKTADPTVSSNSKATPFEILHKIPDVSISRSKQTSEVLDSEEKEGLISIGSQGVIDQSNRNRSLSPSKKHISSFYKSRDTSHNFDSRKQSSRLNESVQIPDRLSIFAEQPQYESTRKLDVPKSRKNHESVRVSGLDIASNDCSKERIKELKTVELPTSKTFDDEEASDIEVSDPENVISDEESREGSVDSQISLTISLSEGRSIHSEVPSENGIPLSDTSRSNNQRMKTSFNKRYGTSFIPSDSSSDEKNLENNLSKKKTAKPIITNYEILQANDVDVRKLTGIREVSKENNMSILSRSQNAIRDENKRSREISSNKSSSDLRKILEDEYDNESEVSENTLIYSQNLDEEAEKSVHEETGSAKDLQRKIPGENWRDLKQKMIEDYFKRRDSEKTERKSQSQRIPFAKAAGNKNLMRNNKEQLEAIVAPIKKQLFKKPRELEPPKKKLLVDKRTWKKKQHKSVDPAYLVNGVPYKPPKLPRPKHWATDHLYKFIWKKIEPKYKGKERVRSEKFVLRLTEVFNKVMRVNLYKNYVKDLDSLLEEMARLGLIVNRKDFNDFCNEFMPYKFRVKATPILLPGNIMSIPYDKEKFYAPILRDDSSLSD